MGENEKVALGEEGVVGVEQLASGLQRVARHLAERMLFGKSSHPVRAIGSNIPSSVEEGGRLLRYNWNRTGNTIFCLIGLP